MQLRGWKVVIVLFAAVGAIAIATALYGSSVRQDYRVASRGDLERTSVDLTDTRVVWVEQVRTTPPRGAVVAYDIATRTRAVLDDGNASLAYPVAVDGDLAAWVVGDGPFAVRVYDFATKSSFLVGGGQGDNITLPGRTLEDRALLVAGSLGGGGPLVYVVQVDERDETHTSKLKLTSAPRILDGSVFEWNPERPPSPLVVSAGRAWWWANHTIVGAGLGSAPSPRSFEAGGPVVGLDADGDLLTWDEDQGRIRRVMFHDLRNGTQGEVTTIPYDQHGAAVNGTRVALVQHDGLVRLKDLATGAERVLPARTQENLGIRLAPHWAVWLSGTIEGHNVLVVPLG
ncbi:MAG TPA: hypothetical protein VGR28_10045 [Candidatus Thermoplasmatota archaeon]|nr:hypothetical protein [Candidatus Thermoplasmatota archaeon]